MLAQTVNLDAVTVVAAEVRKTLEQVARAEAAVSLVAVAEPVGAEQALAEQAEQEPEARCEYGPGNSEHSRAIWPGCAEANGTNHYE